MITDPKTVPPGRSARLVYAGSVGLLAALLIAPQTTEFATKVAVLGALVLVCAAGPLIRHVFPEGRPLGGGIRRWAVGAAVLAGALLAAGIPARTLHGLPAALAAAPMSTAVEVAPSSGVDMRIDHPTALRIAADLEQDLARASDALRRLDTGVAGTAAAGPLLPALPAPIATARAGPPLVVPPHRLAGVPLALPASPGPGGPAA